MAIQITKPPVQATGVSMEDALEIAQAISDLADGEFVTTGETFPSIIETKVKKDKGKVDVDTGRAKANATAHKFMRVIESRFDVKLRSRTWQDDEGNWVFGITAKTAYDEGEEVGNEDEQE